MNIGLDARTIFSPQPRGTGRNLWDAYRLIPALRPDWRFHLYHQRPASACPLVSGGGPAWPANVTPHHIECPGDRLDLWFQLRLPLAAWRDRIDLLHLPANAAPAWCPVPVIVTVHDLIPLKLADELPPRARRRFQRGILRAIRHAVHIIAPSAATRDDLCAGYGLPRDRVSVIPWAPDRIVYSTTAAGGQLDLIRRQYQLTRPWLLNFSGENRRKNAAALLAAFAQLPPELRNAHDLLLVGCNGERQAALRSLAQRYGIADHCRILGFVPHADLPALLTGARALLMPSLAEGFGLPILDAFACSVPVLTSNCSSMPEVAGEAAAYCNPLSPASIAAGITYVLQSDNAGRLVARGAERVRQFTWERTAGAMCAVYERCLADYPAGARKETALATGRDLTCR